MIALHQKLFNADVFVAGGQNSPETCPFTYRYIKADSKSSARDKLRSAFETYDLIIYHWVPAWAIEAISGAHKPAIEVVHRTDTSDSDKSVPTLIVTHSEFLAEFIRQQYKRDVLVIGQAIEVEKFPESSLGPYIGAITSYYQTKGIDLFLIAWSKIYQRFTDVPVRFYGSGEELRHCQRMIAELGLHNVELLAPVRYPERHLSEFRLFVQPSRIEGMPIAILEALACNIPVLCSDLPGMVEFNRLAQQRGFEQPLLLARAEDADDLARVLAGWLSQQAQPIQTRDYIRQYYSVEPHSRAWWMAFGQALEKFAQLKAEPSFIASPESGHTSMSQEIWSQLEVDQLRWLARQAYRLRNSRWYPLLRKVAKRLLIPR